MTYSEMVFDAGLYLGFFAFGLAAGLFVSWVENKAKRA
jgi:hypothetical protein